MVSFENLIDYANVKSYLPAMNIFRLIQFFSIGLMANFNVYSQSFSKQELLVIDSLTETINSKSTDDTTVVSTYLRLSEILYIQNLDTLKHMAFKAIQLATPILKKTTNIQVKQSLQNSIALGHNNIAVVLNARGDLLGAIKHYTKSLELYEKVNNETGVCMASSNMGYSYQKLGNIEQALEFYNKALLFGEKSGNKDMLSTGLNNVANIYQHQGQLNKALEYFKRSLDIVKEQEDKYSESILLNNIGYVYYRQGKANVALEYYQKSLEIKLQSKGKSSLNSTYSNIGQVYFSLETTSQNERLENLDKAKKYYALAYKLSIETNDDEGIALNLTKLGDVNLQLNELKRAEEYGLKAFQASQETGIVEDLRASAKLLSEIYKKQGNGMEALKYYELYDQMDDSLKNDETIKAAAVQQTKHSFEKAKILEEQQRIRKERIEQESISRRNSLQYSIILLIIIILFGLILGLGFVKVSPRIASGLIFFAFLILFEFFLVLFDPYVDRLADSEPLFKLVINACLALTIFPAHAFLEGRLKKILMK